MTYRKPPKDWPDRGARYILEEHMARTGATEDQAYAFIGRTVIEQSDRDVYATAAGITADDLRAYEEHRHQERVRSCCRRCGKAVRRLPSSGHCGGCE